MKRIFLLLSVCALLGMAGCCCCHGHNDCIDDCYGGGGCYDGGYGGGYGQGCDCQGDGGCHRHRHCNLFHHRRNRDCQDDGPCPVDGQYAVDGYQNCQSDRGCKLKHRHFGCKRHKCPHCGRAYASNYQGMISPCCGENMVCDGCPTDCGVMQAGFCGGCEGCGTGMPMTGGCPTGDCGTTGGCPGGNCNLSAPTPAAPGTSAVSHPYDELQALQAAGWSIVPTPGTTTPATPSSGSMEPVPAPPTTSAPPVPVKPAAAH